jgi:hypothetical protein
MVVMTHVNKPAKRVTMEVFPLSFTDRYPFVDKFRLITGLGIAIAGAVVLVADLFRFLNLSL